MLIYLIILAISALTICALVNRLYVPPAMEPVTVNDPGAPPEAAPDELSLVTWNIGYAGMGRAADFFFDLGTQRRPLNADLVKTNLRAIQHQLGQMDADVFLMQEVAKPSWSTYGIDVQAGLRASLPFYGWIFGAEAHTRFVPLPWHVQIGNAIFSRITPQSSERRGLPLEPEFQLGIFRKGYRMHIVRIGTGRQWVIINIHLSAFDSVEDDVRRAQVVALLEFAQEEYRKGNHVIIGGDWNLRLAENEFPNTTEERFKFWIRDFPQGLVPEGWHWAVDAKTPTVRTAYQPYVAGENYVLTIDGFLVSPNVATISVSGVDLNFEHTDHHPVQARFRAVTSGP